MRPPHTHSRGGWGGAVLRGENQSSSDHNGGEVLIESGPPGAAAGTARGDKASEALTGTTAGSLGSSP